VERRADLPYQDEIERRVERGGDLRCDRDAAPWQGQHHHVMAAIGGQRLRQTPAGLRAIPEGHG